VFALPVTFSALQLYAFLGLGGKVLLQFKRIGTAVVLGVLKI
jgi:hypothetical protein